MISIRDVVRRERWEMNRCAHEAELMLLGIGPLDLRDEGDSAWAMILTDYVDALVDENKRMLAMQLTD